MITVILIRYAGEWTIVKEYMLIKKGNYLVQFIFMNLINRSITILSSLVSSIILWQAKQLWTIL